MRKLQCDLCGGPLTVRRAGSAPCAETAGWSTLWNRCRIRFKPRPSLPPVPQAIRRKLALRRMPAGRCFCLRAAHSAGCKISPRFLYGKRELLLW